MTTATIAVQGSAIHDFSADYAMVHFGHDFTASARSEALAGGNAVIAELRDTVAQLGAGVREMKVQSLRVQEVFDHAGAGQIRTRSGWLAQLWGQMEIQPDAVRVALAELIKTGVRIHQLSWHLDPDTEQEAHRAVRRLAVANVREAANDFALALGADLGPLITLADPGLLAATGSLNSGRRSSYTASASAGASSSSWDEFVDVDPEMITVSVNVEASYEITLP